MADIDVNDLNEGQAAGWACVVCVRPFGSTEQPVRVGYLGDDHHYVHACPTRQCAGSLSQLVTDVRPRHALATQ